MRNSLVDLLEEQRATEQDILVELSGLGRWGALCECEEDERFVIMITNIDEICEKYCGNCGGVV